MVNWLLTISFFLHVVATVAWIGGLLLMTFMLWPEVRALLAKDEANPTLRALLDRLRRRFYPIANLSLFVLIVTGVYQMSASAFYEGLLQFRNDWSKAILIKHIAAIGMIGIGAIMQFAVIPALERSAILLKAGKSVPEVESLRRRERRLTAINAILGILVLFCTAAAGSVR